MTANTGIDSRNPGESGNCDKSGSTRSQEAQRRGTYTDTTAHQTSLRRGHLRDVEATVMRPRVPWVALQCGGLAGARRVSRAAPRDSR